MNQTIIHQRDTFLQFFIPYVVGLIVLALASLVTLVSALWAVSIALTVFLAHTSSTQLLLMGIILYFSYRAIKYVRGLPR